MARKAEAQHASTSSYYSCSCCCGCCCSYSSPDTSTTQIRYVHPSVISVDSCSGSSVLCSEPLAASAPTHRFGHGGRRIGSPCQHQGQTYSGAVSRNHGSLLFPDVDFVLQNLSSISSLGFGIVQNGSHIRQLPSFEEWASSRGSQLQLQNFRITWRFMGT